MKFVLLIISCFIFNSSLSAQNLELSEKSVSKCLTNCSMLSEIISQKLTDNTLILKVGAHLNCSVNADSKFDCKLSGDTLNILIQEIQIKRDTVINQTDTSETVTIIESEESASCYCFFKVDMTLKNCKKAPKVILINGLSFAENYKSRTWIEIEEE